MGRYTLRTEVTNSIFTEIQKVFTPDFNESASIFRTISGSYSINSGLKDKFEFLFLLVDKNGRELKCSNQRSLQQEIL
jgi:hypothetical protein